MNNSIERVSLSMSKQLLKRMDEMNASRGIKNRSQAISNLVRHELSEFERDSSNEVMAGTITLIYRSSATNLIKKITDIEFECPNEIISSSYIVMAEERLLEVILVKGDAETLRQISNRLIALSGILYGTLTLHRIPGEISEDERLLTGVVAAL